VLCPVRRSVTTLDCVFSLVVPVGLGSEIILKPVSEYYQDLRWRLLVLLLYVISARSWYTSITGTGISKLCTGRNYTVFTDESGVT